MNFDSLEVLPLYCNTNCCFSVFSCCFTATPALYLFPRFCSFIRSWLIVSLTIFPTQSLGYWLQSQIPSFFLSMLHGTLPNCWWLGVGGVMFPVLCFSYVVGVHSYDSSELFQYLTVFDTMCKKCHLQKMPCANAMWYHVQLHIFYPWKYIRR